MVRVQLPLQMIGQIVVMALLTSPCFAGPQFVDGATLSGYDAHWLTMEQLPAALPKPPSPATP